MLEPNGRDNAARRLQANSGSPNPLGDSHATHDTPLSAPDVAPALPRLSPSEQAERLLAEFCDGQMMLLDPEGLASRKAQYLPHITSMLLGHSSDPRNIESWKKIKVNPRYDQYVVDLIGAAVDPQGNDHLFISIVDARSKHLVPRQSHTNGSTKWNLEEPLFASRTLFCGLHLTIETFPTQDGSYGRSMSPRPLLPTAVVAQEIRRTAEGSEETLMLEVLLDSAARNLFTIPGADTQPRTLQVQVGNQSSDGRLELLATTALGERIGLIGTQTSPIHFDFPCEAVFTPQTHDAFRWGRTHGGTQVGSPSEVCAFLYGSAGAIVSPDQNVVRYRKLLHAVQRRIYSRYQQTPGLKSLHFTLERAIVDHQENTGVLCLSLQDEAGNYYIPSERGVLASSAQPAMLVMTPLLRQKIPQSSFTRGASRPAVPWLLESGSKNGWERFESEIELTLNGIVCSERFYAEQMDELARRPHGSIFEPALTERVRNQLREARMPTNQLKSEVIDVAAQPLNGRTPSKGFALVNHSFGKSMLLLNRDPYSGYVKLHAQSIADALFIEE